jgi:hypothetical protein
MFEMRMVMFTTEETMMAVAKFIRTSGRTLPRGAFVKIDHHPARREFLQMVFESDDGEHLRFPMSEIEVAAALLNECIERRVMMPRNAGKQVKAMGDQFALMLDIGSNPPTKANPFARSRPSANTPRAASPQRATVGA